MCQNTCLINKYIIIPHKRRLMRFSQLGGLEFKFVIVYPIYNKFKVRNSLSYKFNVLNF